jgi:hypothetical protein
MSTRKAKCVLVFMDKSDSTCPGPQLFIPHVAASRSGQLKKLLGGLGRHHRTSSGRTATVGHDRASLHLSLDNVA